VQQVPPARCEQPELMDSRERLQVKEHRELPASKERPERPQSMEVPVFPAQPEFSESATCSVLLVV
jgi:hypothetical protein